MATRRPWLGGEGADYAREALSFPGLRLLLRGDSETRGGVEVQTETSYVAASLEPGRVKPAELLMRVRGHGQMANGLHYIKGPLVG